MHTFKQSNQEEYIKVKPNMNENEDSENDVINLLNESNVTECSREHGKLSLEEMCDINDMESANKVYIEICEYCNYQVEACRKYVALQSLLKHKKLCKVKTNSKCKECKVELRNGQLLRRHMRDQLHHLQKRYALRRKIV